MNNYDEHILAVLAEAGEKGLKLQKIARHVFNASNTFFNEVNFEDVYRYVQQYLQRNSKSRESIIEAAAVRGTYRLNLRSQETQQLMLQFKDDEPQEEKHDIDMSLSLF